MMEKPKRPMSAYLMWLNSARDKIKKDFPGLKVTEIAKKGGEMWRAMDDKSEWEQKAARAKEQYAKALEDYNASGAAPAAPPAKRTRKAQPPPKRARHDASDDSD